MIGGIVSPEIPSITIKLSFSTSTVSVFSGETIVFSGETKTGATPTWFYYRVKNHNNLTNMHYDVLTTSFQQEYKVARTNPVRYTQCSDIEWQFQSSDNGPHTMGIILEALLISDTAP